MQETQYALVTEKQEASLKVYPRRWAVLAVYFIYCLVNSFHWVQYIIISDLVAAYYAIPVSLVEWTSFMYMATIVLLILPACYTIDKKGMRWCLMFGSILTIAGSCLKIWGVAPGRFPAVLLGQTGLGIAQLYMVGTPPKVASIWFDAKELSTACAIGIFGNQMGIGLGLLVPPIIVRPKDNPLDLESELCLLSYITMGASTTVMILVTLFFKAKPKLPPSPVQALERASPTSVTLKSFLLCLGRLLRNRNYVLIFLSNGIGNGVLNMFVTALNPIILRHFSNGQEFAGRVGLVIILFGMLGCIVFGILLDKTHKYKEVTVGISALMVLAAAVFGCAVQTRDSVYVYVAAGMLGLFVMGFMPVAFETSAEVAHPESESTVASLQLVPSNVLGILMTMVFLWLLHGLGDLHAFAFVCASLLVGAVLVCLLKRDYRRLAANSCSAQPGQKSTARQAHLPNNSCCER